MYLPTKSFNSRFSERMTQVARTAFWLLSCSALRATAMTLLMTLSWRFLLILVSERARRLKWGVAPNPAGRAFEVGNALIYWQGGHHRRYKAPTRSPLGALATCCVTGL